MGFLTGERGHTVSSSNSSSSSQGESGNLALPYLLQSQVPMLNNASVASNAMAGILGLPTGSSGTPASSGTGTSKPGLTGIPSLSGGIPGIPGTGTGAVGGPGSASNPNAQWDAYLTSYPDVAKEAQRVTADGEFPNADAYAQWHYQHYGQNDGHTLPPIPTQAQTPAQPSQTVSTAQTPSPGVASNNDSGAGPAPDSGTALQNFANSAGMDFVRNQGTKAIDQSMAGRGMLNSGATGQALDQFGQQLGQTYLNDYLSHILDYAKLGNGSAAILAGAGQASDNTSQGMLSSSGTGSTPKPGLLEAMGGGSGVSSLASLIPGVG